MLNIRKNNMVAAGLTTLYVLLVSAVPYFLSKAGAEEAVEVVEVVQVVDPLDKYRGVTSLEKGELKELLAAVGFEGKALRTAWAVAMKESNGRPKAHNDNVNTGDNSYGIFQINMIGQLGEARREKFDLIKNADLFDPVTNAQIAFYMTGGGTDWSSWKVYPGQHNGERYEEFFKEFLNH